MTIVHMNNQLTPQGQLIAPMIIRGSNGNKTKMLRPRPKLQDQDQDQKYKTKTKTEASLVRRPRSQTPRLIRGCEASFLWPQCPSAHQTNSVKPLKD